MVRLVIVVAIAIVLVMAGLIIIIEPFNGPDGDVTPPPPPQSKRVSINAIPWARVFIKLPQDNNFIAPRSGHFTIPPELNEKNANVTPIRGALVLPERTAIKLVYQEKEKIFPYEEWKGRQTISHDFSGQ